MYEALRQTFKEMTAPGQLFEVTDAEAGGRRVKVWANAPASLRDVWLMTAGHAAKDYLVYRGERWTYAEAAADVARLARYLAAAGIRPGDRVAIAMRNYPEWMLAFWAAQCIGAAVVGINAWWVAEELKFAIKDCAPKAFIADEERLARFAEIRDGLPDILPIAVRADNPPGWALPWAEVLGGEVPGPAGAKSPGTEAPRSKSPGLKSAESKSPGGAAELPEIAVKPEDDACIFYTSGTTGTPKGARLSHRGCVSNVLSMTFLNLAQANALARHKGEEAPNPLAPDAPQIAAIIATPLFHVTANNCVAQTATIAGGKLVHLYKWDAGEALRIIEEEKITAFTGVPTMSRELLQHPDFARRDVSSLATLGGGGAAVQPDLVAKIEEEGRGVRPAQGYGMTEASGIICAASRDYLAEKPGSTGVLTPVLEARCIDAAGAALPRGEIGEVCVRGAQVIEGYLNRPEETAAAIADGWLRTGDIGYIDEDDCIHLVDRAKDMVLRGGENVFSNEVEAAIYRHPGVAECVVFAVPDERLGEEVGAAIYPAAGTDGKAGGRGTGARVDAEAGRLGAGADAASGGAAHSRHSRASGNPEAEAARLDAGAVRAFCESHLAAFKVPRYIWIVDDPLPRNANGKFMKAQLRERLSLADAG